MSVVMPNLFIVGAAKAATTSMYEYLRGHPDVYMSRVKEPHFFSEIAPVEPFRSRMTHVASQRDYEALFAGVNGYAVVGEASPSYLWAPEAARRIHDACPEARIIAILRDPAERAYSHYLNDVREGIERRALLAALQEDARAEVKGWGVSHLYVDLGYYSQQILRYCDVFGRTRMLILFYDDLQSNLSGVMLAVGEFLGIDATLFPSDVLGTVHNQSAQPKGLVARALFDSAGVRFAARKLVPRRARAEIRKRLLRTTRPVMDRASREWLSLTYREEGRALAEVLGMSPPWAR